MNKKDFKKDLFKSIDECVRKANETEWQSAEKYPLKLARVLHRCWYGDGKDAGRYARLGKWEIGLGGYDTGYEVYYDKMPIFAIRKNNDVDMYQSEKSIIKRTGYDFEQIMNALKSVEPDLELSIDECIRKANEEENEAKYYYVVFRNYDTDTSYYDKNLYMLIPDYTDGYEGTEISDLYTWDDLLTELDNEYLLSYDLPEDKPLTKIIKIENGHKILSQYNVEDEDIVDVDDNDHYETRYYNFEVWICVK